MSAWDDDDFQAPVPAKHEWQEEDHEPLADDWETAAADLDAKPNQSSQPDGETKPPPKPKPKKTKTTALENGEEESNEPELTPAERRKLQEESDLRMYMDTLGLDSTGLPSKEGLDELNKTLVESLKRFKASDHYPGFLSHLFRELCASLDSKHVRQFSRELGALADELQKHEKESKGGKKPKAKPKIPLVKAGKDDLEDYEGSVGDFAGDDDDFM